MHLKLSSIVNQNKSTPRSYYHAKDITKESSSRSKHFTLDSASTRIESPHSLTTHKIPSSYLLTPPQTQKETKHNFLSSFISPRDTSNTVKYKATRFSRKDTHKIFQFIKVLEKTPEYRAILVFNPLLKKKFVVKEFHLQEGEPQPCFYEELNLDGLYHPHITNIHIFEEHSSRDFEHFFNHQVSFVIQDYVAHGSLKEFIHKFKIYEDEKLVRTLFIQLIAAIEYLNWKELTHVQIQLENIFIGDNFWLKLGNMQLAKRNEDGPFLFTNPRNYQPNEAHNNAVTDPLSAMLYAAGVILFAMRAGRFPFIPGKPFYGNDMEKLLRKNELEFWKAHDFFKKMHVYFDEPFKRLFVGMTKENPFERFGLEEIKKTKWYNEPTYKIKEMKLVMTKRIRQHQRLLNDEK